MVREDIDVEVVAATLRRDATALRTVHAGSTLEARANEVSAELELLATWATSEQPEEWILNQALASHVDVSALLGDRVKDMMRGGTVVANLEDFIQSLTASGQELNMSEQTMETVEQATAIIAEQVEQHRKMPAPQSQAYSRDVPGFSYTPGG